MEMTATPNPITWLTHNYVHEDWDHLVGNLSGYFSACTVLVVLSNTLCVLGYDFRRLIKMSAVVHAFALVVAPLFSAFARLALAGFVPQAASSKVLGFSTSVSAYVGADIALWAIAAAEAFNNITLLLFELQLLLLLLVPAYKYLSRSTQWLAAASPYIPCIWAIAATLLAIRNPKKLINETKF